LARAFGVYRATPDGKQASDYRAYLQDIELRATKLGVGAWAKTDWQRLPVERQAERQENDELELAAGPEKIQLGAKINPNTAARDQLMLLPGIGEVYDETDSKTSISMITNMAFASDTPNI
jgi:DNA uptake protein ComE-like DNA-binding protein